MQPFRSTFSFAKGTKLMVAILCFYQQNYQKGGLPLTDLQKFLREPTELADAVATHQTNVSVGCSVFCCCQRYVYRHVIILFQWVPFSAVQILGSASCCVFVFLTWWHPFSWWHRNHPVCFGLSLTFTQTSKEFQKHSGYRLDLDDIFYARYWFAADLHCSQKKKKTAYKMYLLVLIIDYIQSLKIISICCSQKQMWFPHLL